MKDPFQQRPVPAFLAAVGFVLLCFLFVEGSEPKPAPQRSRAVSAEQSMVFRPVNRQPTRSARPSTGVEDREREDLRQ